NEDGRAVASHVELRKHGIDPGGVPVVVIPPSRIDFAVAPPYGHRSQRNAGGGIDGTKARDLPVAFAVEAPWTTGADTPGVRTHEERRDLLLRGEVDDVGRRVQKIGDA